MKVGSLPTVRDAPLLWATWLIALATLTRLGCSLWPETPLEARPGFASAVALLRSLQGRDSLVVVWPPSLSRAARVLPKDLLATDAVPLEPADARQYLRILVLGPKDFPTPPELAGAVAEPRRELDAIEVGVFTFPSQDRLLFDLRSGIGEATVSVRGPQTNVACTTPRADHGWDCPGQPPWNNISPTSLKVARTDWPCVWAHPVGDHEVVIDLGERVLGDRIEVEAALTDDAALTPNGSPISLRLEVDGVGAESLLRTNNSGVLRDTMPTPRGRKAGVRLVVSTTNDGRRHFGVNLRLVEARGDATTGEKVAP
jgi:hypothetical protein